LNSSHGCSTGAASIESAAASSAEISVRATGSPVAEAARTKATSAGGSDYPVPAVSSRYANVLKQHRFHGYCRRRLVYEESTTKSGSSTSRSNPVSAIPALGLYVLDLEIRQDDGSGIYEEASVKASAIDDDVAQRAPVNREVGSNEW
jgi:hypothetical protein